MEMKVFENLLSGTIGALVATFLSMFYQHKSEQKKDRNVVMMAVVEWLDNIYVRLQRMLVYKDKVYNHKDPGFLLEEYKMMSNDLRVLLLSERIIAQVVCVYGEGKVVQRVVALRNALTMVARELWTAEQETWADSHKVIFEIFEKKIDPDRLEVQDLLSSTFNLGIRLRRFHMNIKLKKLIAREGLLIAGLFVSGCLYETLKVFIENLRSMDDWVTVYDISAITYWGTRFLIISYSIYLFARFILWAVRTLRAKE